eukprot:5007742-Pyramimonas_sp.AAC.1
MWHHRELYRRFQWRKSHASPSPGAAFRGYVGSWSQWCSSQASPPPSTAFRGSIGSSTEGSSGAVRMRLPHPIRRFVAP